MKLLETSGKSENQHYLAGPLPYSEDTDALTELAQAIRDGLITPDDATRIMKGKTV